MTSSHPYRESLLGRATTTKPLWLYHSNQGYSFRNYYHVFERPIRIGESKRGVIIYRTIPADLMLPVGSLIVIETLFFAADLSWAPHTQLSGHAFLPNSREPIPIGVYHEGVTINISQWERDHSIFSTPKTEDYLKLSKKATHQW